LDKGIVWHETGLEMVRAFKQEKPAIKKNSVTIYSLVSLRKHHEKPR